MNLYTALSSGKINPSILNLLQIHVRTCLGELGTVESIRRDDSRGMLMVILRHFNGEPFNGERAASACTVIMR